MQNILIKAANGEQQASLKATLYNLFEGTLTLCAQDSHETKISKVVT